MILRDTIFFREMASTEKPAPNRNRFSHDTSTLIYRIGREKQNPERFHRPNLQNKRRLTPERRSRSEKENRPVSRATQWEDSAQGMKCNLCKLILTKRGPQKEELPRRTPEKKGEFYEVSRATSSHNYKEDTRRKIIMN